MDDTYLGLEMELIVACEWARICIDAVRELGRTE